jgi:cation diffusion facilitator CzcD-associated flavoprotein CzcO
MTSKSLWMSVAVAPQAVPLQGDQQCDVAVIGGGIAGLSTAYELSQLGRSALWLTAAP